MLLSTAFFPPISWFAAAASLKEDAGAVFIEACENYQKQSYRNRCIIAAAGGPESINVPVVHEGDIYRLPIRDIKVDYSTPWVRKAEKAIDSAYESSPYFEYYRDDVFDILDTAPETLWELNLSLIMFFVEKTGLGVSFRPTEYFSAPGQGPYGEDLRGSIHPKRPDTVLSRLGLKKPYFQVFAGKYGFLENLSIMDLLFCEGPESLFYLTRTSTQG